MQRKGALAEGLLDPEADGPLDITADEIELLLADGGEQGGIADHAAVAQLLVASVEKEIVDLTQRPAAPGGEFLVQ